MMDKELQKAVASIVGSVFDQSMETAMDTVEFDENDPEGSAMRAKALADEIVSAVVVWLKK